MPDLVSFVGWVEINCADSERSSERIVSAIVFLQFSLVFWVTQLFLKSPKSKFVPLEYWGIPMKNERLTGGMGIVKLRVSHYLRGVAVANPLEMPFDGKWKDKCSDQA